MQETEVVTVKVELPKDMAAQAIEVAENEPEFFSRVILYGLTRRAVYRHLVSQCRQRPEEPNGPLKEKS